MECRAVSLQPVSGSSLQAEPPRLPTVPSAGVSLSLPWGFSQGGVWAALHSAEAGRHWPVEIAQPTEGGAVIRQLLRKLSHVEAGPAFNESQADIW